MTIKIDRPQGGEREQEMMINKANMQLVPFNEIDNYILPTATFYTHAGMLVRVGLYKGQMLISQVSSHSHFYNGVVVFGGDPGNPVCVAGRGSVNFNLDQLEVVPELVFVVKSAD